MATPEVVVTPAHVAADHEWSVSPTPKAAQSNETRLSSERGVGIGAR
jgi:hypothetical protein